LKKPTVHNIIETDIKEISRASSLKVREEKPQAPHIQQGMTKFERCLRHKLTKIKFNALTKILSEGHHHN
jgi:hypothetical protein